MRPFLLSCFVLAGSLIPAAGQFTAGNLAVYQVGASGGTGPTLINTGNLVFITEYTTAGTTGIQVGMPGTGVQLIASGTASSEGMMTLGNSGQTLAWTGYNTTTGGGTSLSTTTAAAVNRSVGLLNGQGTVSVSALTDFADAGTPRGAYTTDGTNFYLAGSTGGVRYGNSGSTTSTQLSTTATNMRTVQVAGNQLYISAQTGAIRLATVGTGIPTASGQTITNLTGLPTATGSPYEFFFARVGNPTGFSGPNVLYYADDGGNLTKYTTTDGTTWAATGTATAASIRGLTGTVTGDNQVTLYGTTGGTAAAGGGSIYTLTDSAAQAGTLSGAASTIATAGTNSAFRGIAFAPARLEWSGSSGTWDLAATTFTNTAPTTPVAGQKFVNAYAANFGAIVSNTAVTVGQGINPLAVNVSNAANTYTFTNGASSNGIQGLASLNKSGAGTLVLASSNTYSGGTTLGGGTLLVNNATGSGTGVGAVSVGATGTLGGTGTITGAVSVSANGRIRGGDGTTATGNPTLTTGAITLTNTSRIQSTIGGATPGTATGTRVSAGSASFNVGTPASDVVTIDLTNVGTMDLSGTQSYTFTIATYGSTNASSTNYALNPTNFAFSGTPIVSAGATAMTVTFTPVPEPATVLGLAGGVLGLARVIRRRGRTGRADGPRF